MREKIGLLGCLSTIVYLIAIAWLCWDRFSSLLTMHLNEVGDFLAGVFGPLAILWLVFGFFQQGYELRQNSEALKLQAQELANSVAQQAELVRVAQAQLEADKEAFRLQRESIERERLEAHRTAQPQFSLLQGLRSSSRNEVEYRVYVANTGAKRCTNYSAYFDGETQPIHRSSKFDSGERGDFTCRFEKADLPLITKLKINFIDANGNSGQHFFKVEIDNEKISFTQLSL